jgi:steroid delta-isomerase
VLPHQSLLERHVHLFNAGVRTGDFSPMLEQFTPDAGLFFEGIPVGPFFGKPAIAEAYATTPPTEEIVVLDAGERGGVITARYAWTSDPQTHAGDMLLALDGDTIRTLTIVYGTQHGAGK